jgi:hypothetical protein
VRAGEMGAAEPNSVLRPGFPADGYWLCWMRLSHFSSVTSDRDCGSCCSYLEIPTDMPGRSVATPTSYSYVATRQAVALAAGSPATALECGRPMPRDPATMDTSLCPPPPFGLRTGAPSNYFVVPAPPAATVPAGPLVPNDDDDACPFCHGSSAPMAASLGRRQQRRRKTPTRKRKLGHWGYQSGYSGPRYCQRCSEVFRYHIMEQKPNSADCSRESPCHLCVQVLPHYRPQGSALWAALDAAKQAREGFRAAPGRVQRASRKSRASLEQLLDKHATASASSTHVMSDPRLEDRERRVAQSAARPAPESAERMASNTLAGVRMVVGGGKFGATTQRAQQQSRPAGNGSEVVYIQSEFVAQGSRNKRPRPHALHDGSHRVSQRTSFIRDVPQVGSGDALHRYEFATTPPIDRQHLPLPLANVHSTSAHEPEDNMVRTVGEGMVSDAPDHRSTDPPTMQSMQAREVYDHWLEDPWE